MKFTRILINFDEYNSRSLKRSHDIPHKSEIFTNCTLSRSGKFEFELFKTNLIWEISDRIIQYRYEI